MTKAFYVIFITAIAGTALFLFLAPNEITVMPNGAVLGRPADEIMELPALPEHSPSGEIWEGKQATSMAATVKPKGISDIEKQSPLPNPPEVIKGIYLTGWSAGSALTINRTIELLKRTELNAVVIDIKDFSGYVSYKTGIPEAEAAGAEGEIRILQPNALIKKLHDAGIYVIARQTIFQDPILAKAHPEWALQNASTSETWTDNKGLSWMDAAAKPVWDYNVSIAKDAVSRGFDEINFDYIRFASDGDLTKISYPFWDKKSARNAVIKSFFKYLREGLPGAKISADLFGLTTVNYGDLGIGQTIEDAYEYFDYISPMVYPSHYAKMFLGFQNPAAYPYEVVRYSIDKALERISATKKVVISSTAVGTTTIEQTEDVPKFHSKLRPWLQDFDLGAVYNSEMVRAQIKATEDSLLYASSTDGRYYNGWLLWNPSNTYAEGALEKE